MNKVKYSNNTLLHTLGKVLLLILFVLPAGKSVAQPCLTHSYSLNNTYAAALGGPSLVPAGGSLGASTYTFGENAGLSLSNAINPATYSISMKFRVTSVGGFCKLIDFKDRQDDEGLYIFNGSLTFYSYSIYPPASISPNTDVCVVLTRNGADNRVTAYVNGNLQWSFIDNTGSAIFSEPDNIIHFFKDDFATDEGEATAGVLDDIKLFNCVITPIVTIDFCGTAIPPSISIICPPAITRNTTPGQCGATVLFTGGDAATATGTPAPNITYSPASGSFFPVGTTPVTATATNTGGTSTCTFNVVVTDNEPPVLKDISINCTSLSQENVNECYSDALNFDPFTLIPAVANLYKDNCGTVQTSLSNTIYGAGNGNCKWQLTYVYLIADGNGNSVTCEVMRSGSDQTAPTFTAPADITIPFTSACGYDASLANTGDVTDEDDNCAEGLEATSSDIVSQCGNNIIITRTWSLEDNCENAADNQVQTITVTDNNTDYIVYASKEAKFGEDNVINGDVGVTDANGKAEFKKGTVLDPSHVYAQHINVHIPATVNNKHFMPATGGPTPPFYNYAGGGLSGHYTQSSNGVVPAGNFKNLTIKKNVTATVNGSNYGKITIEENARVTFTSGSIDVEEISVKKGKNPNTTNIIFSNCTAVRVKDKVDIEDNCRVNVDGPKVTFHLGDNKKDEEKFSVKGDNTEVTGNVIMPNGKMKVEGGHGSCIMTGWYIIEKLDANGKNVTWNKYDCMMAKGRVTTSTESRKTPVEEITKAFNVSVYPNPSTADFRILVNSTINEPVHIRLFDISGRTVKQLSRAAGNTFIIVANDLLPGTYFAEVRQGINKTTLKLVKL